MKETHLVIFVVFICLLFLFACRNVESHNTTETYSIDSLVYAKDTNAFNKSVIANMLDLKTFSPEKVIYKTWNNDKDGQKTSGLEAVLFYEEHTYGKILELYMNADFPKGDYKKEDFKFDWLNENLKAELELSKPDYKGNPDIFLGKNRNAKLWFLDKKVLVKLDD